LDLAFEWYEGGGLKVLDAALAIESGNEQIIDHKKQVLE